MNERLSEPTLSEFTLREFYNILFRNKKKILIFFFSTVIISWVYVVTIPDVYLSEALLLIKAGRESLDMIPTSDSDRAVSVSRSRTEGLFNEIEILKSPEIYEILVDEIGIEAFMGENVNTIKNITNDRFIKIREEIISHLSENINIDNKINTNIIGIYYVAESPELANKVVSKLIDIFLVKRFEVHYSGSSFEFYEEQFKQSQIDLMEIEKKLAELKSNLNISSVEEHRSMLLNRKRTLQEVKDNNYTAIIESKTKAQTLKQKLEDLPETIELERITGNENLLGELYSLQLKEQELLTKYSEENIQVKDIRRQINEAKKLITAESQVNRGVNATYQQLLQDLISEQALLAAMEAKDAELNTMMSEVNQELNKFNFSAIKIEELEREKRIQSESYLKYTSSLEEARIDQVVQKQKLSNIGILQHATYPKIPVATRKLRNVALGFFLGFFGSIGFAFVSEYMDHSIKKQEDVEKWLQLRMLVSIPERTE